jgi:hypothetical protein
MKYRILIIALIVFSYNLSFCQNTHPKEAVLKEAYKQLLYCYNGEKDGEPLGYNELVTLYDEWKARYKNGIDSHFKHIYPVVLHLIEHIIASIEETNPEKACKELVKAKNEYLKINDLPLMKGRGLRLDYMQKFSIDLNAIEAFYESEYCISTGISTNKDCLKEEVVPDTTKEIQPKEPVKEKRKEVKKNVIQNGNIKFEVGPGESSLTKIEEDLTIYDKDPIELLRKAISLGLLNSESFEIEEMIPGDSRIIPGVNGVPYEFRLKNADTKQIIYFEPAEYIIPDKRIENKNNSWEHYAEAIKNFKILILTVLDVYGNSAFQIYVQGSADKPTFTEKDLVSPYHTDIFQNIDLIMIDREKNMPVPATVEVGEKYDNTELPDLRGAFAWRILTLSERIKEYPEKVAILKGNVKKYPDVSKRNCTMYIYIDWEEAKKPPVINESGSMLNRMGKGKNE